MKSLNFIIFILITKVELSCSRKDIQPEDNFIVYNTKNETKKIKIIEGNVSYNIINDKTFISLQGEEVIDNLESKIFLSGYAIGKISTSNNCEKRAIYHFYFDKIRIEFLNKNDLLETQIFNTKNSTPASACFDGIYCDELTQLYKGDSAKGTITFKYQFRK